ncbi:MAG: ketol-acid reductoisomerase [Conexibacter sp.]
MARRYEDREADLGLLKDKRIAVVGYGNQGRAQALNLVDSGLDVVVGNREDEYRDVVRRDGLPLFSIAEAAAQADTLMLILPDEVQAEVYERDIAPNLRQGATVSVAHGYTLYYGIVEPRGDLDVVLVAPKMIGEGVRTRYLDGTGFASLVGVHHDASGQALATALAIAKGIGGMRPGAWVATIEEETVSDLFNEQTWGAALLAGMMESFDTLVSAGYDPDVVTLELFASGELADVLAAATRDGLLNGLRLHSPASQYGQLSRAPRFSSPASRESLAAILVEIRDGRFAKELDEVGRDEHRKIDELIETYRRHPLFDAEQRIRDAYAAVNAGSAAPDGPAS